MPIYTYECGECGARFDESLNVEELDKRKLQCPRCKSQKTAQVIAAAYVKTTKKS